MALFVLARARAHPARLADREATEHAAEHTGPGIGGFLNASFGNAPELIIALSRCSGLPDVVRGSLAGSVISNLLLVFGVAQVVGPDGARIDRRSLLDAARARAPSRSSFVLPAVARLHRRPERHAVVVASVPVAIVLLLLYLAVTFSEPAPPRAARARTRRAGGGRGR